MDGFKRLLARFRSGRYIRSRNGAGFGCTTTFENAHRTVLREVLYQHHPWFGRRVCVHGAVDKVGNVVFRCTLDGSQADRWLEVPAWMFDRTACPDAELLTAQPFVCIDAPLSAWCRPVAPRWLRISVLKRDGIKFDSLNF